MAGLTRWVVALFLAVALACGCDAVTEESVEDPLEEGGEPGDENEPERPQPDSPRDDSWDDADDSADGPAPPTTACERVGQCCLDFSGSGSCEELDALALDEEVCASLVEFFESCGLCADSERSDDCPLDNLPEISF